MALNAPHVRLGRLPKGVVDILSRGSYYGALSGHGSSIASLRSAQQKRGITTKELDDSRGGRERILILGSGWAGYTLARALDPKKFQTVVISPRSYFVFTPLLASTSVGTLEFRTALEPIRSRRTQVEFFQGWADNVDFSTKTVSIEEAVDDPTQALAPTGDRHEDQGTGERLTEKNEYKKKGKLFDLKYDKLVVTVGCYSQTFGTPGVKEHALFLKDVGDARRIRNRILACFETAALPTTSKEMKKQLLNFAVVGGGPTGIEFSAELHDLIKEDMARIYPGLIKYFHITVYDVAPKVLSMFDEKLGQYAMDTFQRENITIKTEHHIESLRRGMPKHLQDRPEIGDPNSCWTLSIKEEGEVGVGMVVWSTGLMMNPLIEKMTTEGRTLPRESISADQETIEDAGRPNWVIEKHPKTHALITNDHLQVRLIAEQEGDKKPKVLLDDVWALGDCATIEGTMLPATAQVANQKATWLAKRFNKGDVQEKKFSYTDLGVMAYLGNWNAIMQSGGGNIQGRIAWLVWRGAYLTKSVSWRNRVLIPVYWSINWLFGRDVSRF